MPRSGSNGPESDVCPPSPSCRSPGSPWGVRSDLSEAGLTAATSASTGLGSCGEFGSSEVQPSPGCDSPTACAGAIGLSICRSIHPSLKHVGHRVRIPPSVWAQRPRISPVPSQVRHRTHIPPTPGSLAGRFFLLPLISRTSWAGSLHDLPTLLAPHEQGAKQARAQGVTSYSTSATLRSPEYTCTR